MINVLFARKIFEQKCYFISSHFVLFSFLDDHPAEATFRGNEYIAYDLQQRGVEPILSTNDEISLYFKTRKSSGLLFYTGNRRNFHLRFLDFKIYGMTSTLEKMLDFYL